MNALEIIAEAIKSAEIASRATLDQLQAHGTRYTIHQTDLEGNQGPAIDALLDLCGGAYINIPGTTPFIRELKKIGESDKNSQWIKGKGWSITKGVYKGYTIHLDFQLMRRQEAKIHANAMKAAVDVFKSQGIPATLHTYID